MPPKNKDFWGIPIHEAFALSLLQGLAPRCALPFKGSVFKGRPLVTFCRHLCQVSLTGLSRYKLFKDTLYHVAPIELIIASVLQGRTRVCALIEGRTHGSVPTEKLRIFFIREECFGGAGFQPVLWQDEACGYNITSLIVSQYYSLKNL